MSILPIAAVWSDPVTLTRDEIFQAHEGVIFLTLEDAAPAQITDGIKLARGAGYVAVSGAKVRWAALDPDIARLYRGPAGVL